jgi:salicylate hydroxylase
MSVETTAIVGAGIAGLTAALCLARQGIRSVILERADHLSEVGAGLQISPNSAKILNDIGVLAKLEPLWNEPESVNLVSGITLQALAAVPVGRNARTRWGAPYGVLLRATLQKALLDAVLENPLCRLMLGQDIAAFTKDSIAGITGIAPDLIIGADGVWSTVRKSMTTCEKSHFSGSFAWRFMVDPGLCPAQLGHDHVTAFLGPYAHVVTYPIRETTSLNIVCITTGDEPEEAWSKTVDAVRKKELLRQFSGWNPAIARMLDGAREITYWPLYQMADGPWQNGRETVLIGDAAHAMTPFAAQGASMAIEDADLLALYIRKQGLTNALAQFEADRRKRVARVRSRGAFNSFAYHASGPVGFARDLVLKWRSPASLAADLDWLYGYTSQP